MERFVCAANITKFAKQLEGVPLGPERDLLLKLLAEEEAKAPKPNKSS